MNLQTLQTDMIQAMKSGDSLKKEALSSVISSIKKIAIDKRIREDIPDNIVDECLLKEKKTIKEMIDTCPDSRVDLKNTYIKRLYVINNYCPKIIDDPIEIEKMVIEICGRTGLAMVASNRGALMKTVMPQLKGKVDMKIANKVISKLLIKE